MSKAKKTKPDPYAASDGTLPGPRLWPRIAIHGAIALVVLAGCVAGVIYLRGYVDRTVEAPTQPPAIVFKHRPAWMTDLVAKQLAESFRPAKPKSVFDHDALVETNRRLLANPWIAKVNQVRRVYSAGPGDAIEVDCEFRAPIALVHSGADFWFVDEKGIKLPERFSRAELPKPVFSPDGRTNVRVIEGVRSPPPRVAGQPWVGDDLAAGLEMVRYLNGVSFLDEIVRVNVDNYLGRIDPREAQIVLITRRDTQVRWGRPWNGTDGFVEVRPEVKLDRLRRIVLEFGRVDAKEKWVDIRFDKITTPIPGAEAPAAAQVDGSR